MMFKTKIFLMGFAAIVGSALIGLMLSNSSNAANPEPVTVQVAFVAPITITETNPLEFGSLDVAMLVTETITIDPDNTLTDGFGNVIGGTQASAKADANATTGRLINILVDNVTAGTYYTLATWMCDYNAGADAVCDGVGMSTTSVAGDTEVRVGVTLTSLGGAIAGDDDGVFDLTVAYE